MVRVRFSESEFKNLQDLANDADMSMSEIIRDHLGKIMVRNRQDEKRRVAMLNRINANLNMIARWANTHKQAAESIEVISHLMAIDRSIKEISG